MSTNVNIPFFPEPPREYSQAHLSQVIKAFALFAYQVRNPGEGRNTFLVLTALQTDDVGLETGALFQQGGFVKITQPNTPHVRGVPATGSVGTVTVSIT